MHDGSELKELKDEFNFLLHSFFKVPLTTSLVERKGLFFGSCINIIKKPLINIQTQEFSSVQCIHFYKEERVMKNGMCLCARGAAYTRSGNYPHEKKGKMPGWNTMKFILTQRMNYAWKGHKSPECLMYRLQRTSSAVLTRWPRNGQDLEHNSFSFSLLSILVSAKLTQIMFKKLCYPISLTKM